MPLRGPRRTGALPLVSSEVTSPSSAKGKMSSAHAAPSLEEILQGLGGRSGSCSSKPPLPGDPAPCGHTTETVWSVRCTAGWWRHVSKACTRVSMKRRMFYLGILGTACGGYWFHYWQNEHPGSWVPSNQSSGKQHLLPQCLSLFCCTFHRLEKQR